MYFFFSVVGDITQKGYEKKRGRLLAPYMPKETQGEYFSANFTFHFGSWAANNTNCKFNGVVVP